MAFTSIRKGLGKHGNPGRPNAKNPYVILFRVGDLKTAPVIDADTVSVSTDIELQDDKSAIVIYATPQTIKLGDKTSGDPDKKGFITTLEFQHPGSGKEYSEFVNSNVNEELMAIVVYPDLAFNKLLGWQGNAMQINHEHNDDDKEDTNVLKFESAFAGNKYLHYFGVFPDIEGGSTGLGFGDNSVTQLATASSQLICTESGDVIVF